MVSRKRRQLDAQLPAAWRLSEAVKTSLLEDGRLIAAGAVQKSRLLSEEELDITEHYTARELLDKLARGALSAVAVTTAFSKRAAVAGQLVPLQIHLSRAGVVIRTDASFCARADELPDRVFF